MLCQHLDGTWHRWIRTDGPWFHGTDLGTGERVMFLSEFVAARVRNPPPRKVSRSR